jgi:hypothetical protein
VKEKERDTEREDKIREEKRRHRKEKDEVNTLIKR